MHTGVKITAFAAALAATFGTAYGVGQGIDPVVADREPASHDTHAEASPEPEGGGGHSEHESAQEGQSLPAGGLQISENGYTLDLKTPESKPGRAPTCASPSRTGRAAR